MIGPGKRALVVAHCDDEALWFGGLLIRHPGNWTVIACSIPRADPVRAYKFYDACDALGVKGRVLPVVEPLPNHGFYPMEVLPDLSGFDCIVTHGGAGEYGHPHHIALHMHIGKHYRGKTVVGRYGLTPGAFVVSLLDDEWAQKQAAILKYDHTSPLDAGVSKGEALLSRYGRFNLRVESYAPA